MRAAGESLQQFDLARTGQHQGLAGFAQHLLEKCQHRFRQALMDRLRRDLCTCNGRLMGHAHVGEISDVEEGENQRLQQAAARELAFPLDDLRFAGYALRDRGHQFLERCCHPGVALHGEVPSSVAKVV